MVRAKLRSSSPDGLHFLLTAWEHFEGNDPVRGSGEASKIAQRTMKPWAQVGRVTPWALSFALQGNVVAPSARKGLRS